jgi:hypothetical protein
MGEIAKRNTFKGEERKKIFLKSPVFKVPRQYPLVVLVEICMSRAADRRESINCNAQKREMMGIARQQRLTRDCRC